MLHRDSLAAAAAAQIETLKKWDDFKFEKFVRRCAGLPVVPNGDSEALTGRPGRRDGAPTVAVIRDIRWH